MQSPTDHNVPPIPCFCPSLAQSRRRRHGEGRRAPRREPHREGLVNGRVTRIDDLSHDDRSPH